MGRRVVNENPRRTGKYSWSGWGEGGHAPPQSEAPRLFEAGGQEGSSIWRASRARTVDDWGRRAEGPGAGERRADVCPEGEEGQTMSKESLTLAHLAGIARRVNVRVREREHERKRRTPWLDARDERGMANNEQS